MPKPVKKAESKPAAKAQVDSKTMYLVAYVLGWLTGLIVFLMAKDDEALKFHGMQAILLSLASYVLCITIIGIILVPFIWLYGLYIGYQAYSTGKTVKVPYLGEYAEQFAKGK